MWKSSRRLSGSLRRWRIVLGIAALVFVTLDTATAAKCRGDDLLASSPAAAAVPHGEGLLFRLSRPGSEDSFVLGTLHLSDERLAAAVAAARPYLVGSRSLFVETVEEAGQLSKPSLTHLRRVAEAKPGHAPDQIIDAKELADLKHLMAERGLTPSDTASLRPSVLALMLDLPACAQSEDPGQALILDRQLIAEARQDGKAIVGLETLSEQIEALGDLSRHDERRLIRYIVRTSPRAEDMVETSIRRFLAKDTGGLLAWMRSSDPVPAQPGLSLPPTFLDRLLDTRSRRMAERLRDPLRKGGAFVAVGAAHLPGSQGLLQRLAEDGFTVRRLD